MTDILARDRNGLVVLDYETCLDRLRSRNVGRVALVEAGAPTILPVVYAMAGNAVVFRSTVGSKLEAAESSRPIAFEIDEHDTENRQGWSVLVTGVADVVDDPEIVDGLDALGLDSWALAEAGDTAWIRIRAEAVTGRAAPPRD